jgi:hypothetical protein
MIDQTAPADPANSAAVAAYVATISAAPATTKRKTGLETLSYLLEMVRLEAESATRHSQNGR